MKARKKTFEEGGAVEMLLLREELGLSRYRKVRERDPEKRRLLLELALRKMDEAERDDYLPVGFRRRRLKV
jgi:hypothetical protein